MTWYPEQPGPSPWNSPEAPADVWTSPASSNDVKHIIKEK